MIFYPTLKSLKQKLKIQTINTGRQSFDFHGIVFDDMEALHPIVGKDGYVKLRSGLEFSMIQYRGQNEDFGVCNTTLDRCKSVEEQFLNICRTIAFEELLENHPFVKYIYSLPPIGKNYLNANLTGIAQHYGLHTDYLDITNNFDVACFFATCKYENGKYHPIGNIQKAGIIYKINELFMTTPYFKSDVEIDYLGWQPLPRPEQQRANILKVSKDTNLDTVNGVQKYYFKHSISQSRKIWKMFDEGKTLFPDDSAADLANECSKLNSFTNKQIDKALERFKSWSGKTLKKDETLDSLKIEIIEKNDLCWDNLLDTDVLYWERKFDETMSKVRFRFTAPQFAK
ncbi:FRG domain-containing protein [Aliarcobacter skirrowii]|uniref:FRG domain-containing protein n=1 Tax=Aliarcobacter skirrowii TaxID=28200 RepID=UPI0029B1D90C|nr:FRG domain-containing protein [Aliarcobacter skirrowii]MDX4048218.1 FRG domain-containing protein [Aliarcobacter skirrowii]